MVKNLDSVLELTTKLNKAIIQYEQEKEHFEALNNDVKRIAEVLTKPSGYERIGSVEVKFSVSGGNGFETNSHTLKIDTVEKTDLLVRLLQPGQTFENVMEQRFAMLEKRIEDATTELEERIAKK